MSNAEVVVTLLSDANVVEVVRLLRFIAEHPCVDYIEFKVD